MRVELKNAFTRINILGSDNDNLEKAYDQVTRISHLHRLLSPRK